MPVVNTEHARWYYDSSSRLCAGESTNPAAPPRWTEYPEIEMYLIEQAFQAGSESVRLDGYCIDLENSIEFPLDDDSKRRSVKRETGGESRLCIRPSRLTDPKSVQTLHECSTYTAFDAWCPFLKAWLHSPLGKQVLLDFQSCIEPCAEGIIKEAEGHDGKSTTEAADMVEQLRTYSGKSRREVSELCMAFYTQHCFLYSVLNQALRECDLTKLETLGPFAYLLSNYVRTGKEYYGTVYRGARLTPSHIEQYKKALGTWKSWPAYTSTSQEVSVAQTFGNTLFVITIVGGLPTTSRAFDISGLSSSPAEHEVLIPPGTSFLVQSIDQGQDQTYTIGLRI